VASCFNGIKDNNETGVDCGGLCPACKIQENPSQIGYGNTMVYIVLLVLLILSIIIYAYRKSLSKMLKGWSMHKRKRKVVYITDVQKERLLQLHYVTQQRLNDHKETFAIANLSIFMRLLFRELLAIDHVNQQELQDKLPVLRNKGLESILYTYYLKILEVETRRGGFENNELQAIIDETACVLYLISEFTEKDAMLTPKERILKVNELIDKDYLKLSNLYLALQFAELKEAKALYESLLKDYEALPALQKQLIFNDIMRAYTVMLYMEHQSK
jgi:hypothetical protein